MESILAKECLACGYIRKVEKEYFCPDYECPSCQRVYNKVSCKINATINSTNESNYSKKQTLLVRIKTIFEKIFELIGKAFKNYQEIKFQKEAENKQLFIVKSYKGEMEVATKLFLNDSVEMAKKGYIPTSQNYEKGSYGCAAFLVAVILCVIVIGILIFIYMLIVKPEGKLIVSFHSQDREENGHTSQSPL